jgi:predicted ribosome quality control (RQC) complex YloA/Tae2 family protein
LVGGAPAPPASAPASTAHRRPYRTFVLEDGTTIFVGRGARDNDALTFRHAAPDDRFFHARGLSGAHVILRVQAGREPSDEAIVAAATLAAHFSGSRGDLAADVSCAVRRDLRRGRAHGSVILRASTTRRVRMDPDAIAALLAREVRD